MILVAHIIIALASILWTTVTYFVPTINKLRMSYGLVAATLATGTWLVIDTHSALLQSCMTGLVYLAVVSVGIIAAHRRLRHCS